MPINFAYRPSYGPLSGTDFEKQTVAFFEAIQNDYTEKMAAFSATVDQIRQELATIRGAVEDNANAITALQQRCTDIETDVTANAGQIASQAQQISDLSSTLSGVSGRVTTLETAVSELQELTGQQGDNITNLQGRVSTAEQNITILRGDVSGQGDDIASLQSTTGSLQTTAAEHAERLDGLDTLTAQQGDAITALQTTTGTHTTQISTLQKNVETLESTVAGHTSSINSLDSRVDNLETGQSGQGGDITGLQNQVNALEQSVTTLGNEIAALPDGTTITMSNGKLTCRNVAIGGSLSNLASARGQIGVAPDHTACDWNTLDENAVYWFSNANANKSTNRPSTSAGNLLVFSSASSHYVHQIYMQYNNHNCWHRYKNNNTWGSWQQMNMPTGLIGLYNSTTPPTGFAVCDGTGGTPKLTGYTAGTLRYIRKS